MARFGEINAQYFDDAGDPLGSGKLYFYETGTTTLKTTYSDINQTIANTNPVILSAAGRQPNIFFSGTAKAILTDKNDVQILVRDPVGATASIFGDGWVATKIYSTDAVVLGSDGQYYRSLVAGNQNNDPTSTSGYWTLLYSVQWNSGITYQEGAVVTYNGEQYQSLQNSNLNNNPSSATTYWVLLSFAWLSTRTYDLNENAVGTDGILYTSLQNSNTGNIPASSPSYWVGTSAAAAASATAAATSATNAATSETNAANSATASATSATNSANSATAAATSETNAANSATASATSATNSATSATASANSATAAAASATDAANTYDNFDDRYLGEKSSDPTTDNDGDPLITGALYFNSVSTTMRVYTGSAWQDTAAIATSITLSQVTDVTATAAEVNVLDGIPTTLTSTEIGYVDGVTSPIQTQLDSLAGGITATASGALSDGDPVVIKSDGTVSAITLTSATTGSPQDTGQGSASNGESATVSYDPSAGAMLISFRDDVSNAGRTMAATISGQTITYGSMTNVQVAKDLVASVYYETENATFLCEKNNDDFEVVTVSGTTVTRIAGSAFDFLNNNCYSACYDASADKVIGLGRIDVAAVDKYSLQAVDLTGTTITKGSNTVSAGNLDDTGNYSRASITHDTVKNDNTFVVQNGSGAFIETWSCSGTTLTHVSSTAFPTATIQSEVKVIYGSTSNSYLFFYKDSTNSSYLTVVGATRIGNSFSFGSSIVVASASYTDLQVGYNPAANKFLVSYRGASSYRYLHEVTPSLNNLVLGSAVNISNSVAVNTVQYSNIAYDSDTEQNIIGYALGSDRSIFAVVYDPAKSTLDNNAFIGFSDGAYSDTATATIQVVGSVDDAQTGLTTGKKHYVQADGTLATAPDTPEVFAGTALSATEILIKG